MGAQKLLRGHDASASLRHPQIAPGDGDGLHGREVSRYTMGMGTIMQQTAVLKLRNYSVTVTLVLCYAAGLCCVYYAASISGDRLFCSLITLNSRASNIFITRISILMHTAMILVLMITRNCLKNRKNRKA